MSRGNTNMKKNNRVHQIRGLRREAIFGRLQKLGAIPLKEEPTHFVEIWEG